jgi:hypothetical protein
MLLVNRPSGRENKYSSAKYSPEITRHIDSMSVLKIRRKDIDGVSKI